MVSSRFGNRHKAGTMQRINSMAPKYCKALAGMLFVGIASVCVSYTFFAEEALPGRQLLGDTAPECEGDTVLPLFPGEIHWNKWLRAVIYFFLLVYLFLGVAISADCFMASIEVITSKTKPMVIAGEEVEVEIWNATVANLTLMALGSSAPEILLAVVEVIALNFEAGDLGPGTIVGSAAFNLLFISAICISSLPEEEDDDGNVIDENMLEFRKIEEFGVFGITAIFSLWAYLWMCIVLADWGISPNEVGLGEAIVTLMMFPLLVWISWAQDAEWWGYCGSSQVSPDEDGPDVRGDHIKSVTGEDGKKRRATQSEATRAAAEEALTPDNVAEDPEAAAKKAAQDAMKKKKKSRLEYRIQATRKMTGGKRVMPTNKAPTEEEATPEEKIPGVVIGFENIKDECEESCGTKTIKVMRTGDSDAFSVQFDTSDGDANSKDDYVAASGTLEFGAGENEKPVTIHIHDDDEWAPDKHFYVRLFNAQCPGGKQTTIAKATCQITILNDDDPGDISFEKPTAVLEENKKEVKVSLARSNGHDGNVLAFLRTVDGTALANQHYKPLPEDFEVHFEHEQREAVVPISILEVSKDENCTFTVELTGVEPEGAKVGEIKMCTVIVTNDKNYQKLMEDVVAMMDDEMGKYGVGTSSWGEQFHDAMNMAGDDDAEPEFGDYLMHFLSFYWKVLHALVPPTDYGGGWYTFVVSLCFIGGITCFVGDAAKMFGCCIGLKDAITAITFVALGTSLPDTFASMEATVSDETADAAITNVTGSNSVNVFLGLGLPWTFATMYHAANGSTMKYPSGDLVFSVLVFFLFALLCLGLLIYRRYYCKGELGGPKQMAYVSSAVLGTMWFVYVIISAMKAYKKL